MNTFECHKTHVIACDLDDSLVAAQSRSEQTRHESDKALLEIGAFVAALRVQNEQSQDKPAIYFGSSSGRTFASMQELTISRPAFGTVFGDMDFHIASVGTAIYTRSDTLGFEQISQWPNVASWDRIALVGKLATYPDLTPQEVKAQDVHKISYTTTSPLENSAHSAELHTYLSDANLEANVVTSGRGAWRFVDILPIGVDKGTALLHLPSMLDGSNMTEDSICRIAIGDSMNDQAALAAADVSIIPSNGQPDLLHWIAENQSAGSFYIAEERFAAGALEGLRHHLGV